VRRAIWAAGSATMAVLCALGASAASGGCSSLPDIHFVDDASPTGEGGPTEGGPAEGGMVDAGCKPTGVEICNDGIDNDCNGKTDCQDLRCQQQGLTCQDVPSGWTAVSFSPAARPSCPDGTATIDLKVSDGDGTTASCNCSCKSAGGSCTTGASYVVGSANDAACTTTPTTTTVSVDTAACTALATNISLASRAKISEPSGPTSCEVNAAVSGALTDGRLCQAPAGGAATGGCGANQICAAGGTQNLATCIAMNGKSACPASFPNRSTAGTDATDTRSCTGCACAPPSPCTGGSVSLFTTANCKTTGAAQLHTDAITSSCNALTPDQGFTAAFFKSTPPSGGCGAPTAQGAVSGGLTFANERTICCP
jgi:hypothetical protein